ncbi:UbiA prenyltransferase family protein [Sporocytophaga myxococcoides]|uniref:UbiA prenyltransferase family protein n=1 Tax=Sporocytophaga myxococcoides TaxID=153721 RepID=A0A098LBG1_9BACT|nr:UbiA family prenyltransferase [Sporocytophaga myxococcoides]GAL83724.1 UbiA prenyltransferase family protein [Sporocytophaga myxococcoides]
MSFFVLSGKYLIQRLFQFVIFSNLFISVSSITLTLSTFLILNTNFGSHDVPFLLFIFASTFLTYNVHIWYKKAGDDASLPRNIWRMRHSVLIKNLFVFFLMGLLVSLFFISSKVIWFTMHLAVFSLFYSAPLLNFKRIPFLKIFLISYVWSVSTVVLPSINKGLGFFDKEVIEIFVQRFIFILALAIPFDIRDIELDKRNNIDTLPTLMGFGGAKLLSVILLILFILLGCLFYGLDYTFYSRLAIGILAIFLILKIKRSRSDLYYMVGIDGIMILSYVFLFVFKMLFSLGI